METKWTWRMWAPCRVMAHNSIVLHFKFVLGGGEVIKGWDKGVVGMKEGEKARLIVPPKLGYGKRGSGKEIPPDSTLCFEVTLNKIC